jgi:hypothetical protein
VRCGRPSHGSSRAGAVTSSGPAVQLDALPRGLTAPTLSHSRHGEGLRSVPLPAGQMPCAKLHSSAGASPSWSREMPGSGPGLPIRGGVATAHGGVAMAASVRPPDSPERAARGGWPRRKAAATAAGPRLRVIRTAVRAVLEAVRPAGGRFKLSFAPRSVAGATAAGARVRVTGDPGWFKFGSADTESESRVRL